MILVVDDDKRVVETLRLWLEKAGYVVRTASDGTRAYGAAKLAECQCMILDINMPMFNGPSLLMVLQAEGVDVPVIVITGEQGFSRKEMRLFANVVEFFEKPVDGAALIRAVQRHARKGREEC